jgi:hypothetical protein
MTTPQSFQQKLKLSNDARVVTSTRVVQRSRDTLPPSTLTSLQDVNETFLCSCVIITHREGLKNCSLCTRVLKKNMQLIISVYVRRTRLVICLPLEEFTAKFLSFYLASKYNAVDMSLHKMSTLSQFPWQLLYVYMEMKRGLNQESAGLLSFSVQIFSSCFLCKVAVTTELMSTRHSKQVFRKVLTISTSFWNKNLIPYCEFILCANFCIRWVYFGTNINAGYLSQYSE